MKKPPPNLPEGRRIKDLKDFKGTTEKTEKNGKTEKKDSFHPMILKNFPNFRKISDFSVVKLEPLALRSQILTNHTNSILKIIERFEKICEISVTK